MAETAKPNLTYTCPACGQQAIVGTHFCRNTDEREPRPDPEPGRGSGGRTPGFYALMAAVLIVVLLWRFLGPASLLVVGFGATFLWAWMRAGSPYQELVKLTKSRQAADRLVDEQKAANPDLTRDQAIRRALDDYKGS